MKDKIRWGIIGPGWVANRFADGLNSVEGAELYAVYGGFIYDVDYAGPDSIKDPGLHSIVSKSLETSAGFAKTHGVKKVCSTFKEIISDPNIDIIYVSIINPDHAEVVLKCLNAGKHVLCEKPFALNAKQAEAMIECARNKRLFLMEAIWARFVPVMNDVREWLQKGAIGDVMLVTADMGFKFQHEDLTTRHYNVELGGGSLLDLGIYLLSFASMALGYKPVEIKGNAFKGESGVDEQASISLRYSKGQIATLATSFRVESPHDACIVGTEGFIKIPGACNGAVTASLHREAKLTNDHAHIEVATKKIAGYGYKYEAEEVMRCLREGKTESSLLPLDETLHLAKIMDELRKQWDLKFPGD